MERRLTVGAGFEVAQTRVAACKVGDAVYRSLARMRGERHHTRPTRGGHWRLAERHPTIVDDMQTTLSHAEHDT